MESKQSALNIEFPFIAEKLKRKSIVIPSLNQTADRECKQSLSLTTLIGQILTIYIHRAMVQSNQT
jgi:hypothetical protein